MKKIVSLALASALCIGMLAGCGNSTKNPPQGSQPGNSSQPANPGSSGQPETPAYKYDEFYQSLPFADVYPIEDGEILVNGEAKELNIGVVQTAFNHPWRIAMNDSFEAQCERFPNVNLIILDGEADPAKQANCVDDLLSQGVDAIILSPMDSVSFDNTCKKVTDAGIPLIVVDRDVNNTDKACFIGQSNYSIGYSLGQRLAEDFNGVCNVVELAGNVGNAVTNDRSQGFYDAIASYPDIKVLASGDAGFLREPGSKLMDDYLVAYDKIDAVYSHAEESAWGAVLSIERVGRGGDGIRQYTIDASNEGFRSVESGEFAADGNYTPYIGQVAVRAALRLIMGESLDGTEQYEYGTRYVLPDMPLVTPDNVSEWLGRAWGE